MKKFLLLGTIFVASTALAFGGIGIGPWQKHKNQGVDAIGIHIDGNGKKADIDIIDGDSQEEVCADGVLKDRFGHCNICANGNVYLSYMDDPCGTEMMPKPCETGSDCWNGIGEPTCCDAITHTCKAGTVYSPMGHGDFSCACPEDNNKSCKSNKDCESNEFCNLMNDEDECEKPSVGTCMAVGDAISGTTESLGEVLMSSFDMQWWGADNWCKAQGKSLVDIADFHCYQEGTDIEVTGEVAYDGACCISGENCRYMGTWQTTDFSPTLREVYSTLNVGYYFWTKTNNSICDAQYCVFNVGYFYSVPRIGSYTGHQVRALCK